MSYELNKDKEEAKREEAARSYNGRRSQRIISHYQDADNLDQFEDTSKTQGETYSTNSAQIKIMLNQIRDQLRPEIMGTGPINWREIAILANNISELAKDNSLLADYGSPFKIH